MSASTTGSNSPRTIILKTVFVCIDNHNAAPDRTYLFNSKEYIVNLSPPNVIEIDTTKPIVDALSTLSKDYSLVGQSSCKITDSKGSYQLTTYTLQRNKES